jgi:hypothetical protein
MGCSCLISIRVLVTLKAGRTTEPLGALPRWPPYCRKLGRKGREPRHAMGIREAGFSASLTSLFSCPVREGSGGERGTRPVRQAFSVL